jgi:hypothetical protein
MKTKLSKSLSIPDGKHRGKINDIEYRFEPFKYVDLYLTVEDVDIRRGDGELMVVKYGVPFGEKVTEKSGLGKLLLAFGYKLDKDVEIDELKGRKVSYQTLENENGFPEVQWVKPEE